MAPAIAGWVGVTCSGVSLQNLADCLSSLRFEVLGAVGAVFLLLLFLKSISYPFPVLQSFFSRGANFFGMAIPL